MLHKEVDGSGTEGVSLLTALREKPTKGLDEYMKLPEDDTYFDPDQLEEETLFDPKEASKRNYKKRINKSLNTMGARITLKNNAVSGVWRPVKLVATITSRWRNGA